MQVKISDVVVTGFALFAMFFGAGNVIFPPYLGMTSGTEWLTGFLCFIFIDVFLSCIGIFTIVYGGGGIKALESVVGKIPGMILNVAAVLCTGVLIAPPRTAATTFEMSIAPFTDKISLFVFSIIFFGIVFAFTIRPTRFVDIIGKFLTPVLIICTFILIIAGILSPIGKIAAPVSQTVAEDGIIAGYQTMDILVVSGFGLVMLNTLRLKGYVERKSQIKAIIGVCIVAGILLSLIYGGLAYLGATSSVVLGNNNLNQAQLIVAITNHLMGHTGMVILGIIVGFACLTTAVGLIGSTACFFEDFTNKKIKYPVWVVINTLISISLCNLGLTTIINVAVPILTTICPPFMITVLLLLFRNQIKNTLVYKGIALVAFLYGLISTIQSYM